jgi:hypothetical protein
LKWNTSTCENEVNRDQGRSRGAGRIKWGGLEFGGMGLERRRDTYYTIDRTYFTDPHLFSTSFARIQSLTIQLLPIISSATDAIQGSAAQVRCPNPDAAYAHIPYCYIHMLQAPSATLATSPFTLLHFILLPTVQPASRAYETSSMGRQCYDLHLRVYPFACASTSVSSHSFTSLFSRSAAFPSSTLGYGPCP